MLNLLFQNAIISSIGWAILHSLWQAPIIAGLLFVSTVVLQTRSANLRYLAAVAALLLAFALPLVTVEVQSFTHASTLSPADLNDSVTGQDWAGPQQFHSDRRTELPQGRQSTAPGKSFSGSSWWHETQRIPDQLPWLVLFWIAGVTFYTVRFCRGWRNAQDLRERGGPRLSAPWEAKLEELSRRFGIDRSVSLLESVLVEVPTVIGWLRPVILVPPSTLFGLSAAQMEAVLAHELAHIKRFDYPINLLQTAIEALMFYHPAVRWISRTIRLEREQACDDLAIAVTGDVLTYARALVETERLRAGSQTGLALAVNGGSLSVRIRRLVKTDHVPYRTPLLVLSALIVLALCCVFVGAKAVFSESEFLPEDRLLGKPVALPSTEPQAILSAQRIDNTDNTRTNITRDNTAGEDPLVRQIALDALGNRQGTVIVMDPQTGRIFSVVNQDWALRRVWNPASTVKLITALAAVEENLIDPAEKMRSQKKNHPLDLADALALSDNNYFLDLGKRVGSVVFTKYASRLGLGERTGIASESELAGRLPDAVPGIDSGRLAAYGEGIEATPIQLATMVAALANGGKLLVPQIPAASSASRIEPVVRRQLEISDRSIKHVVEGMVGAVEYGTAVLAQDPQNAVVGKTGTWDLNDQNTGLFISYAPADKPRVVVVVAIKGDNSTGAKAAGIAGTIYKALGHVI